MEYVLLILQGISLAESEIVPIVDLVAKIKQYFALNPNLQISIQNLSSEAIQADNDTLAKIAAWQQVHGLPVTTPASAPPVVDPSTQDPPKS